MFSVDNFIAGFGKVMRFVEIVEDKEHLIIQRTCDNDDFEEVEGEKLGTIEKKELTKISQWFTSETSFDGSSLHKGNYCETAVKPMETRRVFPIGYYIRENLRVEEHGYKLNVSIVSVYYFYALLCFIGRSNNQDLDIDIPSVYRMPSAKLITKMEELTEYVRALSVTIQSPEEHALTEMHNIMQTYLFNIAYNKNIVFVLTDFKEVVKPIRHNRRVGQLFPYKEYNKELTMYYYQGVSTNIPFAQYLAFYHVAEYFFQTISEQDAFCEIKNYITKPSFSPYKDEKIREFYKKIKKIMKEQKEDGVWDEKKGLLLCLKKYVTDLDSLKNTIAEIDPTALQYYKRGPVPFASEGVAINFDDNQENTYITIRNRIYAVRNAIVHSKEGEKQRYEPFKYDKELSRELPLIRAVAEEIIISSATEFDFLEL